MNNFDLSWFTTIPGLFITGGVVLLVIALVILIITGRKTKKEKDEINSNNNQVNAGVQPNSNIDNNMAMPTMNMPGAPMTNPMVNPMMGQNVVSSPDPVVNPQPMVMPNDSIAMPSVNNGLDMQNMNAPIVEPVGINPVEVNQMVSTPEVINPMEMPLSEQPFVNDINSNQAIGVPPTVAENLNAGMINTEPEPIAPVDVTPIEIPQVEPVTVAPMETNPMISEPSAVNTPEIFNNSKMLGNNFNSTPVENPVINEPMMTDVSTQNVEIPTVPVQQDAIISTPEIVQQPVNEPVIYGGANPTVADINVSKDNNHQIYGGADPLQNTQTIPTIAPITPAEPIQNVEPVMVTPEISQQVVSNPTEPVAVPNIVTPSVGVQPVPTVAAVQPVQTVSQQQ